LQNTENHDTDITPCADVVAKYGLSKTFPSENHTISAGILYAQLTRGSGVGSSNDKFSGHAIRPELRYMVFQPFPFQIALRCLTEYETQNATEGSMVCLQLIGPF